MTQGPQKRDVRDDGDSTLTPAAGAKAPLHMAPDCSPPATLPSASQRQHDREAKLKAEARAYALSVPTNEGKNYKRKLSHLQQSHSQLPVIGNNSVHKSHSGKQQKNQVAAASASNHPPAPKRSRKTIATMTAAMASSASAVSAVVETATRTITNTTTNSSKSKSSATALPIPAGQTATAATTKVLHRKPPRIPTKSTSFVVAGGPLAGATKANLQHTVSNVNTGKGVTNVSTPLIDAEENVKDYDPEYLKMIQSLGELDDFSIWDNLDNVEDEEFRLSDIDEEEEEPDWEDDEEEAKEEQESDAPSKSDDISMVDPATTVATEAETKRALPSTPEKLTNDLTPVSSPSTSVAATLSKTVGMSSFGSSPLLDLPGWDDEQEDGGEFYKNLEEELGSLMEEELEAAVQSLYTTNGGVISKDDASSGKKKKGSKKALTKTQQQQQKQQQKQQQSQQLQLHKPNTFVATTTANAGTGEATPVTAATMAAEAKRKEQAAKGAPDTPLRETAKQGNSATVTYKQSQQLRTLMRKHYQLLTQQAILSVRAAQSIKSGHSSSCSSSSNHLSTPPSASAKGSRGTAGKVPSPSSGGGDFLCGENETDLIEILDLAVGMLQDLDQNRKDAIRTSIQLAMSGSSIDNINTINGRNENGGHYGNNSKKASRGNDMERNGALVGAGNADEDSRSRSRSNTNKSGARRSLLSQFAEGQEDDLPKSRNKRKHEKELLSNNQTLAAEASHLSNQGGGGRLTRAAFRKLQAQPIIGSKRTAFDIPGLLRLNETFSTIDESVNVGPQHQRHDSSRSKQTQKVNILEAATHAQACRDVLKDAGANVEEPLLPGILDVSENFSQLEEHLGEDFQPPCTAEEEQFLRKNRNLFTSGEDNLVLRGVNLYGEKQWILIGDRYLPDRSINIISQRYSKLCVMLYRAHGIHIDSQGNLVSPPKLESVDDIDENRVKAMGLKLVEPPAILNVHRWSMEEDLTILKAVPIMGHMWAELGARLIPHRDRGHLRKRYQVLERRVKATTTRGKKAAAKAKNSAKMVGRSTYHAAATTKKKAPAKASSRTLPKATVGTATEKAEAKTSTSKSTATKTRSSPTKSTKKVSSPKAKSKAIPVLQSTATKAVNLTVATEETKPNNGDGAATDATADASSPMMSLESAAASLACIKPKETQKQATLQSTAGTVAPKTKETGEATKLPTKSNAKRAVLQRVSIGAEATTGGVPASAEAKPKLLLSSSVRKTPTYPKPKRQPRMPHGHPPPPPHPHYPYPYLAYPGYYHPAYQYPPPHLVHSKSSEKKKIQHGPPRLPHPTEHFNPTAKAVAESKRPEASSPKPSKSSFAKEIVSPNSKSFLESIPKMLAEDKNLSALDGDAQTSRMAFEKSFGFMTVSNNIDEESQLSARMKRMMENEDESQAANAIVDQLAKSPIQGSGTGLSNLLVDLNSNITGISVLNESSKLQPSSSSANEESGLSIMARVFGKSMSSPGKDASHAAAVSETMRSPKKVSTASSSGAASAKATTMKSPVRGKAGSSFLFRNVAAPHTPTPKNGGYFSAAGTPVGLSPGLRTLKASTLLRDDGATGSGFAAPFSPVPSNLLLKSHVDGGSLAASNLQGVPFSPGPSTSLLFRSLGGGGLDVDDDEYRGAFDRDSRVCEDSNQLGDLAVGATLSNHGANELPPGVATGTNGNSLIIAPEEFDAISGLGALSNSPFKTVKSLQHRDGEYESDMTKKKRKKQSAKKEKSKSFFARVMGESKETSPQKKLRF